MSNIFYIATVGGSEKPIIASLMQHKPQKIVFIVSKDSEMKVDEIINGVKAKCLEYIIEPHQRQNLIIDDHQNLEKCLEKLRGLEVEAAKWKNHGDTYEIVVDFTGGTKCMSASLVLFAQNWDCKFSYVGGTERSKNSVGIVVDGKEQIVHNPNPWIVLGYRDLEKFLILFNDKFFQAASDLISRIIKQSNGFPSSRKKQLTCLNFISEAMLNWDSFNHKDAYTNLNNFVDRQNDFISLFGNAAFENLKTKVETIRAWVEKIKESKAGNAIISDLFMNGLRRHDQGRFDDSVARFYRCTEALAQHILSSRYGIHDTSNVLIELVNGLLDNTTSHPRSGIHCKLGLQDAFKFLDGKNDPLYQKFNELGMNQRESILNVRNSSILAHGFTIIKNHTSELFKTQLLELLHSENVHPETEVPDFPQLPII